MNKTSFFVKYQTTSKFHKIVKISIKICAIYNFICAKKTGLMGLMGQFWGLLFSTLHVHTTPLKIWIFPLGIRRCISGRTKNHVKLFFYEFHLSFKKIMVQSCIYVCCLGVSEDASPKSSMHSFMGFLLFMQMS